MCDKDKIIASLQDTISSLNDRCNHLNELLTHKSVELDAKSAENDELKTRIAHFISQVDNLHKIIDDKNDEAAKEYTNLINKLRAKEEYISVLGKEVQKLGAELSEKDKLAKHLLEDNEEKCKELDELRRKKIGLEKDVLGTAKSFKELSDKYDANERELTKLNNDVNLYKHYIAKYDKLKRKYIILGSVFLVYFLYTLLIFAL